MNELLVSVICITYNHENYIRDSLNGFVSQKTNFRYEVLVHDDASTDGTQQIIMEFAEKYPDLIVPIFEKENQYSQGKMVLDDLIGPYVKGKYIALCEGDDYWCDSGKLQKQVDFMESHDDYVACVHNTRVLDMDKGKEYIKYDTEKDKDITLQDVVSGGAGAYHTSSLLMRKEYMIVPEKYRVADIGDYPTSIYLALSGKIYYFKDVMSVYRFNAPGSWTKSQTRGSKIHLYNDIIDLLKLVDEDTNYEHKELLDPLIRKYKVELLNVQQKQKEILKDYKDVIRQLPLKQRIKLCIYAYFPFVQRVREKEC